MLLTLVALLLFVIGLERHSSIWQWLSWHRQMFFVLQSIGALGIAILALWLLAYRPLTYRSARLAAGLMGLLIIAGLALLCDRANDALMTTGATLLLILAWRLAAMDVWGPQIALQLIRWSGDFERPKMQPATRVRMAPREQPVQQEREQVSDVTPAQPVAVASRVQVIRPIVGAVMVLVAAFVLPFVTDSDYGISFTVFDTIRIGSALAEWSEVDGAGWLNLFWLVPILCLVSIGLSALAANRASGVADPDFGQTIRINEVIGSVLLLMEIAFVGGLFALGAEGVGWVFGSPALWVWAVGAVVVALNFGGSIGQLSDDNQQAAAPPTVSTQDQESEDAP